MRDVDSLKYLAVSIYSDVFVCSTGKRPAAVHAAVAGPQDQQALVACGASTQKTRQASKLAPCQCWLWVCSSLLRSSCYTSGESTPALKQRLMTSDPAPQLLNTLDLDQTTNEQPYSPSSLFHYHYNTQTGFLCNGFSTWFFLSALTLVSTLLLLLCL